MDEIHLTKYKHLQQKPSLLAAFVLNGEKQTFIKYDSSHSDVDACAGFGWGRINLLHSGWCGAVFWTYAEHSVDNIEKFLLLLSRAYIEPRSFLSTFILLHR